MTDRTRSILLVLHSYQEMQQIARDPDLRQRAIEQCRVVEKFLDNLQVLCCDDTDDFAASGGPWR